MLEVKLLNEEELKKIVGGSYDSPEELVFKYPLGMHDEICDNISFGHCFTHSAVITKRGYINANEYYYGQARYGNYYLPCYYFSGDSDVEGWYTEMCIEDISTHNYADGNRINGKYIIIVDQL